MININRKVNRRSLLRGMLNGAGVAVALPLLDVFLNENATALANGAPMPVRFGTWIWGCGVTPQIFYPKTFGENYEITPQLAPFESLRDKFSLLSYFDVPLDGKPNQPHITGVMAYRTGVVPGGKTDTIGQSFDDVIANYVGFNTRFRSLELAADGNPRASYSYSTEGLNPAEGDPKALYTRLFGASFIDPNQETFTPDPMVMVRKSVLSAVTEDRKKLMSQVGAADRARLDQYFTSVRQFEKQLELMVTKPAPVEGCFKPEMPESIPTDPQLDHVVENHKLMAELLAMALACRQTSVFNLAFNNTTSSLKKLGDSKTHHIWTHEEADDPELGYQVNAAHYAEAILDELVTFIKVMDSIPEGDGTMLDNMIVLAHSDCSLARVHSPDNMPTFVIGKGGGLVKTGLHIDGNHTSAARIGLTMQQLMGVPVGRYGTGSLETTQHIPELLA